MALAVSTSSDLREHVSAGRPCDRCGRRGTVGAIRWRVDDASGTVAFCFRCWPSARRTTRADWDTAVAQLHARSHLAFRAHFAAETARRRAAGETGSIVISGHGPPAGYTRRGSWRGTLATLLDRLHLLRQ